MLFIAPTRNFVDWPSSFVEIPIVSHDFVVEHGLIQSVHVNVSGKSFWLQEIQEKARNVKGPRWVTVGDLMLRHLEWSLQAER